MKIKRSLTTTIMVMILTISFLSIFPITTAGAVEPESYETSIIAAAERLLATQNDDGGWEWDNPNTTPAESSPDNTLGVTAQGLLDAYKITSNDDYLAACIKTYTGMEARALGEWRIRGPDITFLVELSEITGIDTYALFAKTQYTNALTTYATDGTATGFAEYIRDIRASSPAIVAWDINLYLQGTLALNRYYPDEGFLSDAGNMAEVIYNWLYVDEGFNFTATDMDEYWSTFDGSIEAFVTTGTHADKVLELKTELIANQQGDGSFIGVGDGSDAQTTAYVIMALLKTGDSSASVAGANYLLDVQLGNGGWLYSGATENTEVTSESLQALFDLIQTIGTVELDHGSDGSTDVKTITIQTAIDAAFDYDTINVAAGVYNERITIEKPLTLRGATADTTKNGCTVPTNYGWDSNVETILNNPEPAPTGLVSVVTIQDTNDVIFEGFIVQSLNAPSGSQNDMLLTIKADTTTMENITIRNNIIGPNTNVESQDGTAGRMGLYISVYKSIERPYGLVDSTIAGNKIFDCKGNGNNVFIWGAYYSTGARYPSPLEGTIIEDNEITGSHRSGIEIAGGCSGLTIRNNIISDNSGLPTDDSTDLKYGNGIVLIRGSKDSGAQIGLGPENLAIENNDIINNEKNGIYTGPVSKNYVITGNNIQNNGWDGIRLDMEAHYTNPTFEEEDRVGFYDAAENVTATHNNIYNNSGLGVNVIGTPTNGFVLNATYNWWATTDPNLIAASVTGSVEVTPWLTPAPDTLVMNERTESYYQTIQLAIDNAESGDTILVNSGTYNENVIINVEDLTLKSVDGAETTTINAGGNDYAVWILQNLGDVTIEGFTVENWMVGGIVQSMSQTLGTATHVINNIVKVPVSGPSANGNSIQVSGNYSTVIGNDVEVTGYNHEEPDWDTSGILVVCASNTLVKDNYVHYVTGGISEHHGGIQIGSIPSWGATAKDNVVENNVVEGLEVGIDVQGDTVDTLIIGNNVTNNDIGIGSYSWEGSIPSGTEIHNNNIINNALGVESGSFDETETEQNVNATYNWYGTTEPSLIAASTNGSVEVIPWLTAAYPAGEPVNVKVENTTVGEGTVDAKDTTDTEVDYNATGNTTITVTELKETPEGTPSFKTIGKNVDVYVPEPDKLSNMTIKVYYNEAELLGANESELRLYYWNATEAGWSVCSNSGVNMEEDYIWAYLDATTTPTLDYLLGGPFTPGVPEIVLNPTEGLTTTISGGGFLPSTSLTITWDGTPLTVSVTTDAVGEFTVTLAAQTSTAGTYTIGVTDGVSTVTAEFTVSDMTGQPGNPGSSGDQGTQGDEGDTGSQGETGEKGDKGDPGKSAYDLWLDQGNVGSIEDFLNSLKGETGATGEKGEQGEQGEQGIQGLQGEKGEKGESSQEVEQGVQGIHGEQENLAPIEYVWVAIVLSAISVGLSAISIATRRKSKTEQ